MALSSNESSAIERGAGWFAEDDRLIDLGLPVLLHPDGHDHTRQQRQAGDAPDGPVDPERIGSDTGQQGANRVAAVAPEAIDADG